MRLRWLALLPATLGFTAGVLLNITSLPNPSIILTFDLGSFLFGFSVLITLIMLAVIYIWQRTQSIRKDAAQQSAQDRRRFIRLLDHELKNPLTAIMAGLANLTGAQSDTGRKNILQSIETQVQRINRLVADLRKLTDLETRPLELTVVNLTEMLTEVYEIIQGRGAGRRRQLNLQLPQAPWPLPEIVADRDLLFLALLNLLDNAIKFSQPDDTIELRASEDGNAVLIEVADTGPGIPADEIGEVWNELYRGKSARGIPGSGLGLALVQAIVSRHRGTLAIRSRPGQGTVVTLRIAAGDTSKLKYPNTKV